MERKPVSQVLNNAEINIRKEYERLYDLFYGWVVITCTPYVLTVF